MRSRFRVYDRARRACVRARGASATARDRIHEDEYDGNDDRQRVSCVATTTTTTKQRLID